MIEFATKNPSMGYFGLRVAPLTGNARPVEGNPNSTICSTDPACPQKR